MTRYAKFELRVKLATNGEFQPCDILKMEATSEINSGDIATLGAHIDASFDALSDSQVTIPTDALDAKRVVAFVDNTESDQAVQFDIWDSSGTDVGEHHIDAGDWAKIPGWAEADETKIKCAAAGETAKVRVIIIGEAA